MERKPHPPRRFIAEIAARQHGVISRRQLETIGLRAGAIESRLRKGDLYSIHRGVYAVGHERLTQRGRLWAALLACGGGALLSHRSAGAVWEIVRARGRRVDVTVVSRGRRAQPGIALHQVRALHPEDRACHDGFPLTSVPRTLLDLAGILDARQLQRAFEAAERLRLLDISAIRRACGRGRGRRGTAALATLLASYERPVPETRTELEARFADLCRDALLPIPLFNVVVEGVEVDVLWPRERLVVELDSFEFHRTRAAFERDRARDARLQLAGFRVLRITWRRLADEPAAVAAQIRGLLPATRPGTVGWEGTTGAGDSGKNRATKREGRVLP